LVSHALGASPAFLRNSRIARTAALLIPFSGCGSWKTARTPFRTTRTRDPAPSETSAPCEWNRLSTSAHAMLAPTGSADIGGRVLTGFDIGNHPWPFGDSFPRCEWISRRRPFLVSFNDTES